MQGNQEVQVNQGTQACQEWREARYFYDLFLLILPEFWHLVRNSKYFLDLRSGLSLFRLWNLSPWSAEMAVIKMTAHSYQLAVKRRYKKSGVSFLFVKCTDFSVSNFKSMLWNETLPLLFSQGQRGNPGERGDMVRFKTKLYCTQHKLSRSYNG